MPSETTPQARSRAGESAHSKNLALELNRSAVEVWSAQVLIFQPVNQQPLPEAEVGRCASGSKNWPINGAIAKPTKFRKNAFSRKPSCACHRDVAEGSVRKDLRLGFDRQTLLHISGPLDHHLTIKADSSRSMTSIRKSFFTLTAGSGRLWVASGFRKNCSPNSRRALGGSRVLGCPSRSSLQILSAASMPADRRLKENSQDRFSEDFA